MAEELQAEELAGGKIELWDQLLDSDNNMGLASTDNIEGIHESKVAVRSGFKSEKEEGGGGGDGRDLIIMKPPSGGKKYWAGRNGKESGGDEGKEKKGNSTNGEQSDHEIHIWTERERRKKMRTMFSNLHSLLPQLPPKADKSSIVDEAINYIKTLEHTVQKLQKQRVERLRMGSTFGNYESREAFLADHQIQGCSNNYNLAIINNNIINNSISAPATFQTWTSSNVVLNISGSEAQFSVCSPKKPGFLTTICYIFEKHRIEVVSAHISSDSTRTMYMIHAQANRGYDQFMERFAVEETFKQAAGEIMFWISSGSSSSSSLDCPPNILWR